MRTDFRSKCGLHNRTRCEATGWWLLLIVAATCLTTLRLAQLATAKSDDASVVERRILGDVEYLADDKLEGRGPGTHGIDLAADYIAQQFKQAGLATESFEGTPFQPFTIPMGTEIGDKNSAVFVGPPAKDGGEPERIELELENDYSPMSISGSGPLDLPLVFVGYGITSEKDGYDDYAGLDVTGKAVIILRHEPRQDDPDGPFDGTKNSAHAALAKKVSNAGEHGAGAVIFCTDEHEISKKVRAAREKWQAALDRLAEAHAGLKEGDVPGLKEIEAGRQEIEKLIGEVEKASEKMRAEFDPVMPFGPTGSAGKDRDFPVIHCRRAALEQIVAKGSDKDLATLEQQIDESFKPHSCPLEGWRVTGQISVKRSQAEVKNVVGVLAGEGPTAEETIVVGAHYDHLGFGGKGSRTPNQMEVHNGADDNASGTAVMIELARRLAARETKLPRRIVFIAFAGEERGLLGSKHYVSNPLVPIKDTVAMVNLDMVGRLRDNKLTVTGTGTAEVFGELLDRLNREHGFQLTKKPGGKGPSDHASFFAAKVPAMHFFTDVHARVAPAQRRRRVAQRAGHATYRGLGGGRCGCPGHGRETSRVHYDGMAGQGPGFRRGCLGDPQSRIRGGSPRQPTGPRIHQEPAARDAVFIAAPDDGGR